MDDLHARLVSRIKEKAEAKHISLSHLPDRAGVSRAHFWDVLGGRKSPTVTWLRKVADALEVDGGDLLCRHSEAPVVAPRRRSQRAK